MFVESLSQIEILELASVGRNDQILDSQVDSDGFAIDIVVHPLHLLQIGSADFAGNRNEIFAGLCFSDICEANISDMGSINLDFDSFFELRYVKLAVGYLYVLWNMKRISPRFLRMKARKRAFLPEEIQICSRKVTKCDL